MENVGKINKGSDVVDKEYVDSKYNTLIEGLLESLKLISKTIGGR